MPLRSRHPSWVLTATVAFMPLWWALGLAAFIWIIALGILLPTMHQSSLGSLLIAMYLPIFKIAETIG